MSTAAKAVLAVSINSEAAFAKIPNCEVRVGDEVEILEAGSGGYLLGDIAYWDGEGIITLGGRFHENPTKEITVSRAWPYENRDGRDAAIAEARAYHARLAPLDPTWGPVA